MIAKITHRISGEVFVIMARVASAAPLGAPLAKSARAAGGSRKHVTPASW
jgi:hypothetical protein